MKVYFGKNFWGSGEDGTEMEEIRLNQSFLWEDISGFIPSVYVDEEGIAIDFCIRVSNEKLKIFFGISGSKNLKNHQRRIWNKLQMKIRSIRWIFMFR